MITISLCMIVKNEENTLERCLNSVAGIVNEIVIVDTGSIDNTTEIARRFTEKVYSFDWIDDFSAARNYSYSKATCDYILWLDADDIILPEDAVRFRRLKETLPPDTDTVMFKYNTAFDGDGNVTFSYYRERLTRRECGYRWEEPVHEYLATRGARLNADVCVTHAKPSERTSGRNLRIYQKQLADGRELSSRGMYYYARELRDSGNNADAIVWFEKFLDSERGWVEDNINACGDLANCYLALGKEHAALAAFTRSFVYDTPRGEICCQLGYFYKERGDIKRAAFWFNLILGLERGENWGFTRDDCWGFVPCLELAVCYDKLGDTEQAERFNERAAEYKPNSPAVTHNREYFNSLHRKDK